MRSSSQYYAQIPEYNPEQDPHFPPLAKSCLANTGAHNKTVRFTATPGYEHSTGTACQSYAEAAGGEQNVSNHMIQQIMELHDTLDLIMQQLSQNMTLPEFNIVCKTKHVP